ncbi:hypothetical protein PRK78_005687 [Emydomyces testavorans]|uniref:BTB domain-containing protein n=1 Tax=Emydomyces testavorans TaxID=2070801 RepID=A0AAF0DM78_9EURO|nr:hypothetical protein PRK78_005687 [Emydomyces testavorans]
MTSIRFRGVPVITITVGESKAQFQAHKDLLCEKSPFFNGALTHDFKEAAENAISLPEDNPDTFERFLQWLYSGSFSLSGIATDEEVDERYLQLSELYVLADKLEVPHLKNDVIDELFVMKRHPDKPPQAEVISYVYENTGEKSPLRKLMVAWLVWHVDFKWYTTSSAPAFLSQCPEFAADLAVALARRYIDFNALSPFNEPAEKCYKETVEPPAAFGSLASSPKSSRLVSSQKQPLTINAPINALAASQSTSSLFRPPSGFVLGGSGIGASRIGGSSNLRVSEPLRSPGLPTTAPSEAPAFGSTLLFTSTTGTTNTDSNTF